MSSLLNRRIDGAFYIITFDYTSRLNCFRIEDYAKLGEMLLEAEAHPDVLFTILQAKGHYFSSGLDISTLDAKARLVSKSNLGYIVTDMTSRMEFVTRCFINHSKVLVACLNGPAIGLTAAMIMHCDFVYSINDKVYLEFPFSKLGLGAEGCLSVTLSDKLPVNLTKEALLLGNPIGYEQLRDRVVTRNYNMANTEEFNAAVMRDLKADVDLCNPKSILAIKELTSKIRRPLYNEVIGNEGYAAVGLISEGTVVESLARYQKLIANKREAKL